MTFIDYEIDKTYVILGRKVKIQKRSKHNAMGRFGGGWQWHLGIQGGGSTIIVSLVTFYIRIDRRRDASRR